MRHGPRALALALLAFCVSMSLHGKKCIAAHAAALTGDMEAWNIHRGTSKWDPPKRIWTLPEIQPAYQHLGSPMNAKNLLDKLNNGQRIITVAIGSSFVAWDAGCWHTSLDALRNLGIIPNPTLYPQPGEPASKLSEACTVHGYMRYFMDTLNSTWPHFDHIFVNHGRGGTPLENFVDASCLDTNVPEEIDLLLLDPATVHSKPAATELLMRKYLGSKSRPAVILVSNTYNCESLQPPLPLPDPFMTCNHECMYTHNLTACNALGPEPYSAETNKVLTQFRAPIQSLAMHYDIPHINLHHLVNQTFLGPDLHRRLNITKWQLLARLYSDGKHFQKCQYLQLIRESRTSKPLDFPCVYGMGSLLLADLLVNWLYMMQQVLAAQQQLGAQGQGPAAPAAAPGAPAAAGMQVPGSGLLRWLHKLLKGTSGSDGQAQQQQVPAPSQNQHQQQQVEQQQQQQQQLKSQPATLPAPLHADAMHVYRSRCYGISYQQLMERSRQAASNGSQEQQQALEALQKEVPGNFFSLKGNLEGNSYQPLTPLNVTRMDGFTMQLYYKGAANHFKYKPGFLASSPGSTLVFEVDTQLEGQVAGSSAHVPEVVLTYTTSYDGWGRATVSCQAGCTCSQVMLEAANTGGSKHSLLRSQAVKTTPHPKCRVMVQVANTTNSTGHKFKVSSVMVRMPLFSTAAPNGTNHQRSGLQVKA